MLVVDLVIVTGNGTSGVIVLVRVTVLVDSLSEVAVLVIVARTVMLETLVTVEGGFGAAVSVTLSVMCDVRVVLRIIVVDGPGTDVSRVSVVVIVLRSVVGD